MSKAEFERSDVLVSRIPVAKADFAANMFGAKKKYGVSPSAQLRDIVMLAMFGNRLPVDDYYRFRLFDHDRLSREDQKQFVSDESGAKLNRKLNHKVLATSINAIDDKMLYVLLLDRIGIRTPTTQAICSRFRRFGDIRTLKTRHEIADFLRDEARYPLFGKPTDSSLSIGAASVISISDDKSTLTLGDGRTVDTTLFAAEIAYEFGRGYVFQDCIRQHPDLVSICGDAIGTVRLVTVRVDGEVIPLYALWKIPSLTSMADNFWRKGNLVAHLDEKTGEVIRCQHDVGVAAEEVDTHPETGKAIKGYKIPGWDQVLEIAETAMKLTLDIKVIGWDIAITPDGPMIVEANTNPSHPMYQIASGKGIMTPEMREIQDRVVKNNADRMTFLRNRNKNRRKDLRQRKLGAIWDGLDPDDESGHGRDR